MAQQHRPLTGMVQPTGIAAPVLVAPGPIVIHQIDASSPTNFLDQVTLFVQNNDAATQIVRVVVAGAPPIDVSIGANATRSIFVDQPFFGQAGQPASSTITVQALAGAGMVAWGYFTRN